MSGHARFSSSVLAAALAVVFLASCSSSDSDNAPKNCPSSAVLAPTSTLTAFRPGMKDDPAGVLYTVGISQVGTACQFDANDGTTDSSLELTFKATRSTSADSASYRVPYYVAVAQADRVLSKATIWVNFAFAPGASTAEFNDSVESTKINLENGKKPYDYEILVGLQLTHDQLEYNEKIGRYAP
jgi:hypothetical protein